MLQHTLPLLLFLLQPFLSLSASETKIFDIQGEVLNVQKFTLANQPVPFVQILLHTSDGDITVEIGPEWYLEAKGINLLPQDRLTISGLFTEIGNTKIFIAYRLKKEGNAVRLRTKNGTPAWNRSKVGTSL